MTERENALLAIHHEQPQWVPAVFECLFQVEDMVNERPIFETGYDCFGVHWIRSGPETNYITHEDPFQEKPLDDVTEWEDKLVFPDLDVIDWKAAADAIPDEMRREKLINFTCSLGIFERMTTIMTFEDALCSFLEEPEATADLCAAIADFKIAQFERLAEYIKPDIVNYHDDWGTQSAPFLSREVWDTFIKPNTARIYDCLNAHGIMVSQHSCGKVESFVPDMIEMGATLWNSCQDCNDLARLKREYGDRIVFSGALNDQGVLGQPGTTEKMLREEVEKKVSMLADGGGWIGGPNAFVSFNFDHDRYADAYLKEYSMKYYAAQGKTPGT